jgi:hypothetical protein
VSGAAADRDPLVLQALEAQAALALPGLEDLLLAAAVDAGRDRL